MSKPTASEVDVVDALRECAEAWEPDVCVLGNVRARDVVAVCERLREAERERDQMREQRDNALSGEHHEHGRAEQAEKERDEARNGKAGIDDILQTLHKQVAEMCAFAGASPDAPQDSWTLRDRLVALVRERDEARERESYALAAIERNDEVHAEALRAVRQRAERAEQTRDAHAEALAQAARDAGDLLDRIAALVVERDDARSLLAHAERAIEQGTGDCLLVDHLKRALMERDEARAALIRSQEDHRAAVEALETYEERIGDIADHVLGLVPPDVPSIVKLDAIERRCGEERVAARQAERERDEARAHQDYAAWRAQYDATVSAATRAEAAEARWSAEQATALEALRQAEAAEARVRELEARLPVDGSHMPSIVDLLEDEVATLRAIADAAAALTSAADACDREAERHPSSRSSAPMVRYIGAMQRLRAALAARGKETT